VLVNQKTVVMDTSYYPYAALSCASFLTFYRTVSPAVSVKYFPIYGSLPHAKQVEWNTRFVVTVSDINTHPFNGPFSGTTQVGRYQKGKPIWILLEQETVSGSGISWATCKSAPRSRQITTPAPHHSVFLQAGCPSCRPTNSVKALKAVSVLQKTLGLYYISVKVQAFHHMYHFISLPKMIFVFSMLQQSVPYLSDFPPYGRNSWTLWHRCRNVQAQGPKCLGLWFELSQHWDRNFSVPKCLDAKVSSGTGAELSWVRCVR